MDEEGLLYGGDPCPQCGARLGYEEAGEEREPEIIHPDPQCGWRPDGYPSTREGSSWEERMADRAQIRIRAERERERARMEAECAAAEAALEEQYRAHREAGPPGGCHECWSWWVHWTGPSWAHGESVQPGPPPDRESGFYDDWREPLDTDWCWHPCHGGEPVCCIPVAYAAG